MSSAESVLSIARGEIGYSRWNDPENGTKYGRWYASLVGSSYYGENGVPYCAMFASWCFNQAGATCSGLPGAYCPTMLQEAQNAGRTINKYDAQPGDVIYFNWDGGEVDHVGIVEKNLSSYVQTIEGNTGNGEVLRRTRSWDTIAGIVRPDWGVVSQPSSPSTPTTNTNVGTQIDVDGQWGPATTRALQAYFGTPVDGIVSQQYKAYQASNPGLLSSSWEWVTNPYKSSNVIIALQNKLGVDADSFIGPSTIRALQSYLGCGVDGRLDNPSPCIRALQSRLNSKTL